MASPRFLNVTCSSCGQSFGPGDHGFSHCVHHVLGLTLTVAERAIHRRAIEALSHAPDSDLLASSRLALLTFAEGLEPDEFAPFLHDKLEDVAGGYEAEARKLGENYPAHERCGFVRDLIDEHDQVAEELSSLALDLDTAMRLEGLPSPDAFTKSRLDWSALAGRRAA